MYIIMDRRSPVPSSGGGRIGPRPIMPIIMAGGGGGTYGRPSRSNSSILARRFAALIPRSHSASNGRARRT
jgi:hypothetical protein